MLSEQQRSAIYFSEATLNLESCSLSYRPFSQFGDELDPELTHENQLRAGIDVVPKRAASQLLRSVGVDFRAVLEQ